MFSLRVRVFGAASRRCLHSLHALGPSIVALQRGLCTSLGDGPKIVCNEEINAPEVRLVYNDQSGARQWKILALEEAIQMARAESKDLVLVSPANPPVCKIEKASKLLHHMRKKEKKVRAAQKPMKEAIMSLGISAHDFNLKMQNVKDLLSTGHQVRLSLRAKPFNILDKQRKRMQHVKVGILRQRRSEETSMQDLEQTTLAIVNFLTDLPIVVTKHDSYEEGTQQAPTAEIAAEPDTDVFATGQQTSDEAEQVKGKFLKREFIFAPRIKSAKT